MRYIAKRKYEKHDSCGDSILWQCDEGDNIDIKRVNNISVAQIINRDSRSPLSVMWMNVAIIERFIDDYLVNPNKVE